jgi:hypothetical protein
MAKMHAYVYVHPSKGTNYTWANYGTVRLYHGQIVFFEGQSAGVAMFEGKTYDTDKMKWTTFCIPWSTSPISRTFPPYDASGCYSPDPAFVGTFYGIELANYKMYGDSWRYAPAAGSIYSIRTQYQNAYLYTVSGTTYTQVGALKTTGQKVIIGAGQSYIAATTDAHLTSGLGTLQRIWGYIQPNGQVVETSGYYIQNSIIGSMVDAYTLNTK